MFDKKNCMWILCVCEWIVNNELLYYSKLNQYLVFCPIKSVADLQWCFCETNHNFLTHHFICNIWNSLINEGHSSATYCVFLVVWERIWNEIEMEMSVNGVYNFGVYYLVALWSWPRVMTYAHNSVSAAREIHSWPGNEKVLKWVYT